MINTFGIIGAGNIAQAVAKHVLKAGYKVIISNSGNHDSLQKTVAALGGNAIAGTAKQAAEADITLLALPWAQLSSLSSLTDWKGRKVIDATNHYISLAPEFQVADLGDLASSEVVARLVPGALVVKAFNTLYFETLAEDPNVGNGHRVMFISGDDNTVKKEVAGVIESLGFAVVDLGNLHTGSKLQQAKGPLSGLNLISLK